MQDTSTGFVMQDTSRGFIKQDTLAAIARKDTSLAKVDEGEVWDQHIVRLRPYKELDAFEKMRSVKG